MTSKKVLIANRGEIAIRISRAAAALGWETVAIFSEDDSDSKHRYYANQAFPIPGYGSSAYLDVDRILHIASEQGCTRIHPGYGFLSENADFVKKCDKAGITFIGPTEETVRNLGNKLGALRLAESLRISVLPGTRNFTELPQVGEFFDQHGSLMIKALAGGGGRGMCKIESPDRIQEEFSRCSSEAKAAFGNGELYVEKFLSRARHIEVQILGDGTGDVLHFWERDCTLQRRNQKLIEVCPAPNLSSSTRDKIIDSALRLARNLKYRSLGTFEFLLDENSEGDFYFIEANPRLQVEHTVTEEALGVDLVELQLRISEGSSLKEFGLNQETISKPKGFAIQLRLNAESIDEKGNLQPSTGRLSVFEPSNGPGIRVDTAAYTGYAMNPSFDPLLAKLIVRTRSSEFKNVAFLARRALREFRIQGSKTNRSFLNRLLRLSEVEQYKVHTGLIDENFARLAFQMEEEKEGFGFESNRGNEDSTEPETHEIPMGTIAVLSPVSGRMTEIDVVAGDFVRKGQKVAVVSAMKMEHLLKANENGVVEAVLSSPGKNVSLDQVILVLRPSEAEGPSHEDILKHEIDFVRADLQEVFNRLSLNEDSARQQAVSKRHKRGQRTARENVADLCDPGTFVEYGALAIAAQRRRRSLEELIKLSPADGLVTGIGSINGDLFDPSRTKCAVLAYDYTVFMGTQGAMNHKKTDRLLQVAKNLKLPLVFFTEGGGGRPGEVDVPAVAGLDLHTFRQYSELCGMAPRIAVASGRCFAGNAALFGSSDIRIATKDSNIGMGGPVMVKGGGLGNFSAEEIGPVDIQSKNGVIDLVVENEIDAVRAAKRSLSYFQGKIGDYSCKDQRLLRSIVPENRLRSYDVRALIEILSDDDSVLELRSGFSPGIVTAFIRIEGRPIGLIANNSMHLGGAIDAEGAEKAADFMKLCESFRLPILSLCDTPGFMVGPDAERLALVRKAGRLFQEGAVLKVPFFTIVLRKGYGLGAMAMAGGSFHSPVFTVSWPSGEFGAMGIEGEIRTGYQKELAEVKDWNERQRLFERLVKEAYERGKAINMASYLEIDAVIDPADSRKWILRGLASEIS